MANEDEMDNENEIETPKKPGRGRKSESGIDTHMLETAALQIFKDMWARNGNSFDTKHLVREAFSAAKAYTEVAMEIRETGIVPKIEPPKKVLVKVQPWEFNGDTEVPKVDDNGRPVLVEVLADFESYAINKPAGHHLNQGFYLSRHALGLEVPAMFKHALESSLQLQRELAS